MAKDDGKGGWKESIWNPRTKEFLGRTASSWGLIILFYIAFYIFLAGVFILTMYVMLQTLDDNKPKYQDRLGIPGMMIRPKHSPGGFLEIDYMMEDTETWDIYVQALDQFLSPYNDTEQVKKNYECPPDKYFFQSDSGSVKNYPKRSCQFNRSILGECSGLTDRSYGFGDGQPCVIIKLNKVIGLLPGGKDGTAPFVTCAPKRYKVVEDEEAEEGEDKMGQVMYFPPNGTYNLMYYPYYGKKAQVNYSQPLVAIKFLNITTNTDINIECKVTAGAFQLKGDEKDKFAGKVMFRLRVNTRN
ncbi:sodium/potassium-transporting ATPase subunit beta-2b isoform X2 [Sardina pilchardus]|uniref:sodium/potassium-transporting ATPase subunit beta-2b isoform X2 n=1 Tax=Sardina pilchardus TaxID=27697 RepID=UPI002E12293C